MYKHTFDFGSTTIEIIGEKKISKTVLDQIYKLIQFIRFDFNYKIHHSSAYEFNDVQIDSPVKLSPEFIHYLKINLTKAVYSEFQFNPFKVDVDDIYEALLIDDSEVIKKSAVFFDSTLLLLGFTIDQISEVLIQNKVESFLISTKDIHLAIGKRKWEIKFEIEDELEYELEIKNESVGLHFNKNYLKTKTLPQSKFGFKDTEMIMKYCVFKSANAVTFKVISKILENLTFKSQFQEFSTLNKIPVHIVDKDDNEITIKPYLNWE